MIEVIRARFAVVFPIVHFAAVYRQEDKFQVVIVSFR